MLISVIGFCARHHLEHRRWATYGGCVRQSTSPGGETHMALAFEDAVGPGPVVTKVKPLLIYVNVPFCNSKCHFCDWVAQVPIRDLRMSPEAPGRVRYNEALGEQMRVQGGVLRRHDYQPAIMYWGGGTASILTESEIEQVFGSLSAQFDLSEVREATIEGSPESLSARKLALFRRNGFNRISIGVQSFEQEWLRRIGRAHNADQAAEAVLLAEAAGFENINIDLIVGFPGQTLDEVEKSVRTALTLPVNHFSIYPYRSTPGTVLRKQVNRGNTELDLENQYRAYCLARDILEENGHPEYAMSYFGDPRCQSDEAYYRLQMDWIGFGSGANSLIGGNFLTNTRGLLHRYNESPAKFDVRVRANVPSLTLHFLSQALTTAEGMDAVTFYERTGTLLAEACAVPAVAGYLDRMRDFGELIVDDTGIRIRREDIARVYVALNWITVPTSTVEPLPLAATS
jgi:coproporphyrinogen III oxidase-like Fe-S oxidoreductase